MTVQPDIRVVARTTDALGESPCWHPGEARLYWVDLRRPSLHRLGADGAVDTWEMPGRTCAVLRRANGGVVVAMERSLVAFDPETRRLHTIAAVEPGPADMRLNDAKCDAGGRL